MNSFIKIEDTDIMLIDGDRGINYPSKNEFYDKEYCLFLDAKNITEKGFEFSETHFITKEKDEILRKGKLERNDIVMMTRGSVGNVALYDETVPYDNVRINSGMVIIRCKKDFSPLQLYYLLKSNFVQKQIFDMMSGSVQKQLPISIINKIKLFDNNLKVEAIYAIDKKIENNNKISKELESFAKTLYDYWFLQFDFPDKNGKPYKSSGGKMQWSEELNKEIPKGWCGGTLNRYIAKDKGGDWGKEVEEGNYIKRVICLRGADFPSITGNSKLAAPVRYILEKNKSKVLENGDLIIEISGGSPTQSTGRICYINNNLLERFDTDIVTSNFCKAISLKNPNYMYWFYVQWLKIYDNNVLFRYEGKTTGIKNLLFDLFINDYNIAVPPNELIIQYNNIVCTMYEEIQKNQKESQELASLRDFLLPLLMNGQVGFK